MKRVVDVPGLRNPQGMALIDEKHLKFVISCATQGKLHFVELSHGLDVVEHRVVETGFRPKNLSISPHTNQLLVADNYNQRITIFSLGGDKLADVTPKGGNVRELNCAEETKDGYILLDGSQSGKIIWLDKACGVTHTYGTGPREKLDHPWHMMQDPEGNIIVADTMANTLRVINPNQEMDPILFAGVIIEYPKCLFVDKADGYLYVGHASKRGLSSIRVYKYMSGTNVIDSSADVVRELSMNLELWKLYG